MSNRLIRDEGDLREEPHDTELEELSFEAPIRDRRGGHGPYRGRRQVTAHIDEQLFKWLRAISLKTDTPMVRIFEEALAAHANKFAVQKKIG